MVQELPKLLCHKVTTVVCAIKDERNKERAVPSLWRRSARETRLGLPPV